MLLLPTFFFLIGMIVILIMTHNHNGVCLGASSKGDEEPPEAKQLFRMSWIPTPSGPNDCKPARPWTQSLKTYLYGYTNFTQKLDESRYFLKKPLPTKKYSATADRKRLSWHTVNRRGVVYQTDIDAEAYAYLQRLSKRTKGRSSLGPDASGFSPSGLQRRYVFDSDARFQISCGYQGYYPTSTIGQITSGCSGTLIGPRHVLTAAHCVHSGGSTGDWYYNIMFQPQLNCPNQQVVSIDWVQLYAVTGWTLNGDFNYDYAVIELASDLSSYGWMPFGYDTDMTVSWNFNIRGYMSEDKPSYGLYNSYNVGLVSADEKVMKHKIDIVRGSSGAMMYRYISSSGQRIIYGVQSHQYCPAASIKSTTCSSASGYNGASRMTGERFEQICAWINDPVIC